MFNLLESPFIRDCQSRFATTLGRSLGFRRHRRRNVRVYCSSKDFDVLPLKTKDVHRPWPAQQRHRIGGRRSSHITGVASFSNPFADAQNGALKNVQNGSPSRSPVEVSAKGKWQKQQDSSLSADEPLPLPMTWPNSEPPPREKIDKMLSCNPETQDCKSVIYQWTGDCKTCQGTGLVSFYRKRREVISKCMNCLGIGSVHKITSRADIQDMDGTKGSQNGSARSYGSS